MAVIAWLVLCVSVMVVGAAIAIRVKAALMVRRHKAGSEYLGMAFAPVFLVALLAGMAGPMAGFWLAGDTGNVVGRSALYTVGGILAAWELLAVIEIARAL